MVYYSKYCNKYAYIDDLLHLIIWLILLIWGFITLNIRINTSNLMGYHTKYCNKYAYIDDLLL